MCSLWRKCLFHPTLHCLGMPNVARQMHPGDWEGSSLFRGLGSHSLPFAIFLEQGFLRPQELWVVLAILSMFYSTTSPFSPLHLSSLFSATTPDPATCRSLWSHKYCFQPPALFLSRFTDDVVSDLSSYMLHFLVVFLKHLCTTVPQTST